MNTMNDHTVEATARVLDALAAAGAECANLKLLGIEA
jgi:hypothetical protein